MSKYIPVGIFDNELYMTEDVDHKDCLGHMIFYVIRPVTRSELEYLQSEEHIYEACDELWREKVRIDDDFTGGLDDFVEMVLREMPSGDEYFIFKDSSFCSVLDDESKIYQPLPEWDDYTFYGEYGFELDENDHIKPLTLRQFVDMWIEYNTGEEIGTWEASGGYSPHEGNDFRKPKKFDYVLNEGVANIWYEQVGL